MPTTGTSGVISTSVQERPEPMLDVHPPHTSVHTWKDFFIHLATIVLGLLIAVGLEQLVERAHDRYKLQETREALRREREANGRNLVTNAHNWRWEMAELQNNLMVLQYIQHHPDTAQASLPGDLRWDQLPLLANRAVWDAAEQNGVIRLMPMDEANSSQVLYEFLQTLTDQNFAAWNAINDARRFDLVASDPTHLSPQQLAETIQLTVIAIEKHIQVGLSIAYINSQFPDIPAPLTYADMRAYRRTSYEQDPQGLSAAHQLTMDRLKAAGYAPQDDDLPSHNRIGR